MQRQCASFQTCLQLFCSAAFSRKLALQSVVLACLFVIATVACDAKSSVSLNVLNPDRSLDGLLRPYMINLRQRIQSSWHLDRKVEGSTKICFEIGASGDVSGLRVSQSSGDAGADRCSMSAVSACAPFPPPPIRSADGALNIVASFKNNQQAVEQGSSGDSNSNARPYPQSNTTLRSYISSATKLTSEDDWEDEKPSPFASRVSGVPRPEFNYTLERVATRNSSKQLAEPDDYSDVRLNTARRVGQFTNVASMPSINRETRFSPLGGNDRTRKVATTSSPYSPYWNVSPKIPTSSGSKPDKSVSKLIPSQQKSVSNKSVQGVKPTKNHRIAPGVSTVRKPAQPTTLVPPAVPGINNAISVPSKTPSASLLPKDFSYLKKKSLEPREGGGTPKLEFLPFVLGLLAALLSLLLLGRKQGIMPCPFCAEPIKKTAILCRHCKSELSTIKEKSIEANDSVKEPWWQNNWIGSIACSLLFGLFTAWCTISVTSGLSNSTPKPFIKSATKSGDSSFPSSFDSFRDRFNSIVQDPDGKLIGEPENVNGTLMMRNRDGYVVSMTFYPSGKPKAIISGGNNHMLYASLIVYMSAVIEAVSPSLTPTESVETLNALVNRRETDGGVGVIDRGGARFLYMYMDETYFLSVVELDDSLPSLRSGGPNRN